MKNNVALLFISALAVAACSNDNKSNGGSDGGLDGSNGSGGKGTGGSSSGGSSSGGKGGSAGSNTDGGTFHVDRSHLKNTGTTGTLDYSDRALWACLPGNDPNECHDGLDATEFLKDNKTQIDKHVIATDPPFDCFYVYPTVALGGNGNMTDFSDISLVLDPLVAQAARFTRICEVYAPLYRQVSLALPSGAPAAKDAGADAGKDGGGAAVGVTGDAKLGYGDVKASFDYYMAHYNKGRKFVLMGHSQGTAMLTQLVLDEFDGDANANLRKQLISALLIGGSIQVPVGKDVGGTFKNIPICKTVGQTGCVVAYNSFAKEAPPPANSLFGRGAMSGWMDACTNPAVLAGNTGNYRGSYMPIKFVDGIFAPDAPMHDIPAITTPFRMERDAFAGTCKNENGFSYLEISTNPTSDDKRPIYPYRTTSSESLGFGMHIADYSIELDDLIDTVDKQAKAAK